MGDSVVPMMDPLEVKAAEEEKAEHENNFLVAKIIYKSKLKTIYSAMLITIDLDQGKIVDKNIALSHEPEFLKIINEESTYQAILTAIKNKKADNLIPIETITDVDSKVVAVFTKQIISTLNVGTGEKVDKAQYFGAISNIKTVIVDTLGDPDAYIVIGVEKIEKSKVQTASEPSNTEEDDFSDITKKEKREVVKIATSLVLSPVYGRSINEVEPGDVIMVIVENNSTTGKAINTQFKTVSKEGKVMPLPALLVKKYRKANQKGQTLILKIADGVYSTVDEVEPVKVQTYDDIKLGKNSATQGEKSSMNLMLFVLGFSIVIVLAVTIYFLIGSPF